MFAFLFPFAHWDHSHDPLLSSLVKKLEQENTVPPTPILILPNVKLSFIAEKHGHKKEIVSFIFST